jgi:hypothetical protein
LLKKAKALYEKGVIVEMGNAEVDWSIELNANWTIRNLSPSEAIMTSYLTQVDRYRNSDLAKCSSLANLLSGVLCIYNSDGTKALLTSDAEIEALDHISDRNEELFQGKLILGQIPHHGSKSNHRMDFWMRFTKDSQCPVVVSSGENQKNKHPDREVIQAFETLDFKVFATNDVHGFRENRLRKTALSISSILDDESESVEEMIQSSDQVFQLRAARVRSQS